MEAIKDLFSQVVSLLTKSLQIIKGVNNWVILGMQGDQTTICLYDTLIPKTISLWYMGAKLYSYVAVTYMLLYCTFAMFICFIFNITFDIRFSPLCTFCDSCLTCWLSSSFSLFSAVKPYHCRVHPTLIPTFMRQRL